MLFLTNKLDYITQISSEIIKSFLRLGSFIAAAGNMTLRKRRHLPNR